MKWKIILLVICTILLSGGLFIAYVLWYPNIFDQPQGIVITISKGMSFQAVCDSLFTSGVIRNKWSFTIAARMLGVTKSIRAGKYLFTSGNSNQQLLYDISKGKSLLVIPVTIPEGWRLVQIARRFQRELGIDAEKFLNICHDTVFIQKNNLTVKSLEGYLLPATYSFNWQTEEEEIVKRMLESMLLFYNDSLKQRQVQLKVTQHEILTLASIVEAEAINDEERSRIAGVYWNRLRKNMRLEADPTVQYALGEERRLLYRDLDINSPYNTYRRKGLPPGPINNPGKMSILATLYPEEHNYLYFVADGYGGHRFAANYSEHQKNVQLYRKTRRQLQKLAQMQRAQKNEEQK